MPSLPQFIAVINSEASDIKIPYFEDVTSAEVPRDAPGGVGTAPMEEVEMEEEEEEEEEKTRTFTSNESERANLAGRVW